MDLSKAHAGPGSQIAGNFSEVLESLIQIIHNNNEQKMKSFETQQSAASKQFGEIVSFYNEQADSTRHNAMGSLTGSIASGVALGASHGFNMYQSRGIGELEGQMKNLDTFRNKLAVKTPTNTEISQGPLTQNQTKLGEKFLNGDTEEALKLFQKKGFEEKTDELITGAQFDKARAEKKADNLHSLVRSKREEIHRNTGEVTQKANMLGQVTQGISQSAGGMQAANDQAAQGEHEARKTQLAIMLEFVKSIQDNASQAKNYAAQQRSQILEAERSVFQSNYARG